MHEGLSATLDPPGASADRGGGRPVFLQRWEKWALVLAVFYLVLFGAVVELRSAFLNYRKGDLGVFLRAAWAVRSGADLYDVTDDNGFHYLYPPLFAIVLTPLADPPSGADRTGTLPYPVSVGIWYLLNLACLALAVHCLASALSQAVSPRPRPGEEGLGARGDSSAASRALHFVPRGVRKRWWILRLVPVLACMAPVGHTLMRGQVGLLLLLFLCAMTADFLHRRRLRAGLWLAGAICLKVIPAFLLIYPLWRRDARALAGCAVGLVFGLVLIPVAVLGPARTARCYGRWTEVMLLPTLGKGEDRSRAKELHDMTATDSQSLLVILHNTVYPERSTRPTQAAPLTRGVSLIVGGILTLLTLAAAGRRRRRGATEAVFVGMLVLLMLLQSPVCHLHYFCLSVIPFMAITAWTSEHGRQPIGAGLALLTGFHFVANALPHFPGLELLRDLGLAMVAALVLWLAGCLLLLWRPDALTSEASGAAA